MQPTPIQTPLGPGSPWMGDHFGASSGAAGLGVITGAL